MAEEPLFTAVCLRCEASAGGANSGRLDGGPSETGSVTVPTAELVPSQRLRQCPRPPCAVIKGIQPVHPKGDQSWVFTGRTDVEAETPILWPLDAKS